MKAHNPCDCQPPPSMAGPLLTGRAQGGLSIQRNQTLRSLRRAVSTAGGLDPRWRDDGRAVFYRGPGNRLIAVNLMLQPNGRLEAGAATDLFTMPQEAVAYDITRDGQRVLVDMPVGPATTPPITIIQNWKHQP